MAAQLPASPAGVASAATRPSAGPASAPSATGRPLAPGSSVVLAFVSEGAELAGTPGLSAGLMSATQGSYSAEQMLLDITQGARVASSAYTPRRPPPLRLSPAGSGAVVSGWPAAVRRAADVPQLLRPGLLAQSIPGGGAYAGVEGADQLDGIAAADRSGRVTASSIGDAQSLLPRIETLRANRGLVVCDLPEGPQGNLDLRSLIRRRPPGELLIVVQRASDRPGNELLWVAAAGLAGGAGRRLTSSTTNQSGLISAIDLAPTILEHLGQRPLPADMRGKAIRTDGTLHADSLRTLLARLHVVGGRRLTALGCLLGAWALLLLGSRLWRSERAPRMRSWAMRVGALAVLWAPFAVLAGAVLEPTATVEYATITLCCLALGALTDALVSWPRAPIVAAVVTVVALVADALAGTQLLMRSLLGPDPILGARFYGFGNELKSGLAVLVLAAVAGALYPVARGRRAALAMASAGIALAAIEGSAKIGAGVGGVVLVSAGFAVATVMLIPGAVTRRRALLVLACPLLALVALAALDLLTAHGSGHFTGSILHARSTGDLRDVLVRRYGAAWRELRNHAMPLATLAAIVAAALGVSRRERLLAPVAGDPGWTAALAGGLAAGVVGALSEDSGPVLLVVAVFALGCVASYLWGRPEALGESAAKR